eukprot:6355745-Amphidinium_carterae.1
MKRLEDHEPDSFLNKLSKQNVHAHAPAAAPREQALRVEWVALPPLPPPVQHSNDFALHPREQSDAILCLFSCSDGNQ